MLGLWAGLAGALLSAAPPFVTDASLEPQVDVRLEAEAAWGQLEATYQRATGETAGGRRDPVRLRRGTRLLPGRDGESHPGLVELRQAKDFTLDERLKVALRHELAHQFLWAACPAAAEDRLFHEAFAVATSGELAAWSEGEYLSLSRAVQALQDPRALDTPQGRRALARLLVESGKPGELPPPLQRRLKRCNAGWQWTTGVGLAELAREEAIPKGHAFVVVSRHSGEVLAAEGDAKAALPFGSTLKPFVVAGATSAPPVLAPRRAQPEWMCGSDLPAQVDVNLALVRSCNGYFLDWAARAPQVASFGAYGPVFEVLGMARVPADMTEAIGLRTTLALSPLALARAYRLLAEARPDILATLKDTARVGTLSKLPDSEAMAGVALKTGTVRDAQSNPRLGWIVAVDDERVAVMVRTGKMPRSFLGEFRAALEKVRAKPGQGAAKVQVLGLLDPGDVEARCPSAGFAAGKDAPWPSGSEYRRLKDIASQGAAVCLGAPWQVRFPGLPQGREYAGVFTLSPPPPYRPPPGPVPSERALRARRGSDFIFRTTALQYTSGVLAAEDANLTGEARAALARVVAHNVEHSRHPGRPVCDTTHCQAFQGTVRARAEDAAALGRPPLPTREWLLFSQGGDEPWTERRPRAQVEAALGTKVGALRFDAGRVWLTRTVLDEGEPYETEESQPCELLRSPLKLPACPRSAREEGGAFVFEGRGKGHGEGLDVEQAKQAKVSQDEILRRAYGFP